MSKLIPFFSLFILGCISVFCVQAADEWPGYRGPKFDGTAESSKFSPGQAESLNVSWRAKGGAARSQRGLQWNGAGRDQSTGPGGRSQLRGRVRVPLRLAYPCLYSVNRWLDPDAAPLLAVHSAGGKAGLCRASEPASLGGPEPWYRHRWCIRRGSLPAGSTLFGGPRRSGPGSNRPPSWAGPAA